MPEWSKGYDLRSYGARTAWVRTPQHPLILLETIYKINLILLIIRKKLMIIAGLLLTTIFVYSCCYYSYSNLEKKKLSLRDYKLKWKLL